MKLYVDDVRDAPDGWYAATDFRGAISILEFCAVKVLSLDHDLGEAPSGYDIAQYMIAHGIWPKDIFCHSMNPVGRENILALLERYAPVGVTVHRER